MTSISILQSLPHLPEAGAALCSRIEPHIGFLVAFVSDETDGQAVQLVSSTVFGVVDPCSRFDSLQEAQ